jgi:mRNA interferase RelE/StbE
MAQYAVRFKQSADKALRKLPEAVQKRIAAAAKDLRNNPRPRGCVKLEGADDLWRIRVGDYRVVYAIEDDELIVVLVRVAHRKDVYRG